MNLIVIELTKMLMKYHENFPFYMSFDEHETGKIC